MGQHSGMTPSVRERIARMYLHVTFVVEAESEGQFMAAIDEDAVAAALPGPAWLMWVEKRKSVSDEVKATWRM
jgi:hypothetical protein